MSDPQKCPRCGAVLAAGVSSGLCTRCVLQQVIEDSTVEGPSLEEGDYGKPVEDPPASHLAGEGPGRYTGEREHARGGMGRILIAHDEQLGRDVVIKELLPESVNGSKDAQLPSPFQRSSPAITRFLREARVTGQLQHPAIVPVHELGRREDGTLYYTMKQVQGISLSEAIRQADGLGDRLELLPHFLDLCHAVSYAHSRGVIHRDIKPGNVMVGEFGETVLLDWGLAKVRGQEDLHGRFIARSVQALDPGKSTDAIVSTFGQVLGTPVYMAPEQARAESDRVNERTDVYALGAVLYTLLTGKPPFAGERSDEILAKVVGEEPPPVLEVEIEVPRELAAICQKAMAKTPEDRYDSAKELAHEVQRFLSGGLVAAYEYGFWERLRRFARRNRKTVVTAAVALLLLVLLAGSSYFRILGERNKAVAARQETEESLTLAETNLRLAESAVDELLAEVSENDLMNLPKMEPVRRKLLESALVYCEQIAEQHPEGDAESMRQTAEAQSRLGKIYALLGQHEEAVEAYRQARAGFASLVREQPDVPQHQAALAKSERGLGQAYDALGRNAEALAVFQQARDAYAALVEAHPEMTEAQEGLAQCWRSVGVVHHELGQHDESFAAYAQAREAFAALVEAHPEVPDYRDGLAKTLMSLGNVFSDTGKAERALAAYEQAREAYAALVEAHPEAPEYRDGLARALNNLGIALSRLGKHEESIAAYEQAREQRVTLVEAHPEVPGYRSGLAGVLHNLGNVFMDTGKAEEALASYEQVREQRVALVEAHPEVPAYRAGLAVALNNLGVAHSRLGQNEKALAPYEQSRETYAALVEAHPEVPDYRDGLALALNNLGATHSDFGQTEEALASYEQARDAYAALVETHPEVPDYRSRLALALYNLFYRFQDTGKTEEALASYEQGMELDEFLVQAHPEIPWYRDGLAGRYNSFAGWMRKRDPARALETAKKAVEVTERKDGNILNTLATMLDESGRVDEAIKIQKEAIAVNDIDLDDSQNGYVKRLRKYEARLEDEQKEVRLAWERNKDAQWNYLKTTLRGQKLIDGLKGSWSPDGSQLVYVGTNSELSILDLNTGESSQVSEQAIHYSWSPDGSYIAWSTQNQELWIAEPSGKGARTVGSGMYCGWSPDGKTVYGYSSEERKVYAFDIDDADGAGRVFCDELPGRVSSISPDGSRIVLTEHERLWVVDRDTKETRFSWAASGTLHGRTAWSPDGTRLAFGGGRDALSSLGLWVLDLETEKPVQVIKGPFVAPTWSPDGSGLLFCCRGVDPPEIWMMETRGLEALPDLLTTAKGRVLFGDGRPVPGARVTTAFGKAVVANPDGSFSIPDLKTVYGDIVLRAGFEQYCGASAPVWPVREGVTNVGDIVLAEPGSCLEQTLTVGPSPCAILICDLNGDGYRDIVTSHWESVYLSVLLGNGRGTFEPELRTPLVNGVLSIVAPDMNGDDVPDLVTTNAFADSVAVLLGIGNGTFEEAVFYNVGDRPLSVAVADLNGDHSPEIVTANTRSDDVSVLVGTADGGFKEQQRFSVGKAPASVVVLDVDRNGISDLVVANRESDDLSVFVGLGDATFEVGPSLKAGTGPTFIVAEDLNGDEIPDLAVANMKSEDVSILTGNRTSGFDDAKNFALGQSPRTLTIADVNRDGISDLVTSNLDSNSLSFLLGKGDGTFDILKPSESQQPHYSMLYEPENGEQPLLLTTHRDGNVVSLLSPRPVDRIAADAVDPRILGTHCENPDALVWSTFLGGEGTDGVTAVAVDRLGDLYVAGTSTSRDFPVTSGAYDETYNGPPFLQGEYIGDAYLAKFDGSTGALVFATFLGGSGNEEIDDLLVLDSGEIIMAGTTGSDDFPTTPGVYDESHNGGDDIFVAKLNATGDALVYSTFLGGADADFMWSETRMAVDASGNIYLTGLTGSSDFPTTPGVYQPAKTGDGGADVFVAKLSADGTTLVYSTFLGGSARDLGLGVAVDRLGEAYVVGRTRSMDFPVTPGAYQGTHGSAQEPTSGGLASCDAFVTKLTADGSALVYSTFLGGPTWDMAYDVLLDAENEVFVAGSTDNTDFPTTAGAYDETHSGGNSDMYLLKLNATGTALVASTLLGGDGDDFAATSMSRDPLGNIWVSGHTGSPDVPLTSGALHGRVRTSHVAELDGPVTRLVLHEAFSPRERPYVAQFDASLTNLLYATFLDGGTPTWEEGFSVADGFGNVFVAGATITSRFPVTEGAFDTTFNDGDTITGDAFVTKLNPSAMVTGPSTAEDNPEGSTP